MQTTGNCNVEIISAQDTILLYYQSPEEGNPLLFFPFIIAFNDSGNTVQFCSNNQPKKYSTILFS